MAIKPTLEGLEMISEFWSNKNVFITGHTGFKGGWLSLWLHEMGAKVHGYSLEPPTTPNFFTVTDLANTIASSKINDIRDLTSLIDALDEAQPDIVFHLAAQPLVRHSYIDPVETYATNVMGTVNLFEAIRKTNSVRAVINVTTDKCYENKEWFWSYRENEALGGFDPYSSSKACSELVTSAYRNSFLSEKGIALASARAGNVIGGGDWAQDRLIPDFLRAIDNNQKLIIRSPNAVRPWQHVLEPLSGYLALAQQLYEQGQTYASAWNFGPSEIDAKPVSWIVETMASMIPSIQWELNSNSQPHEANFLKLDSSKAKNELVWWPRWNLETALQKTIAWHKAWVSKQDMNCVTIQQISDYQNTLKG